LDVAVLAGYPGTITSTWQQSGRAGRRTGASMAILIANSSPLNQFVVNHPDYFFAGSPEHGLINPDNLSVLLDHIKCAAFELPFRDGENFGNENLSEILSYLETVAAASDRVSIEDAGLSTLGNPLADLANQCMAWMLPRDGEMKGLAGIDRSALGIPTDEEYLARYCERTGRDGIPNWNFYLVFSMFRLAAILQGIVKRVQMGTASSAQADERGAMVKPLARLAIELT
jgi:hypothetical protein